VSRSLTTIISLFLLFLSNITAKEIPSIPRRIPPPGVELTEAQKKQVTKALEELNAISKKGSRRRSDIKVIHKAIRFALENSEFYDPGKDLKKISSLLKAARAPESSHHGLKIRGYESSIDGSLMPYGIDVPEGLDLDQPIPVWIWLHGRGDKETDFHFLHSRLHRGSVFRPKNAIVIHPFGRQCIGWKHAGEIDIFDALEDLSTQYKIDSERVALCGFSMGGAGAWHVGAHYTDQFAAVHAGAGFAETAQYTKLKPQDYPASYEQSLWGLYDVPNYALNLTNAPLIAYSGEKDKQIQAALVMSETLAKHGHQLMHVIGPGMGHKYDPDSVKRIKNFIGSALQKGRTKFPKEINFQTRTLRYNRMHWLEILGLDKHWEETSAVAKIMGKIISIDTKNISSLRLDLPFSPESVRIQGQEIKNFKDPLIYLQKVDNLWSIGKENETTIRKRPGLQGPIDDAFMAPFIVSVPKNRAPSAKHQRWIEFEIQHFKKRWKELFRGELRIKNELELTKEDHANYNIIAWGTPQNSALVRSVIKYASDHDPLNQVVSMIRPNPINPKKYLVVNSGPTFRENHDRTNSLQNPKFGDWVIIDLRADPDGETPGKIISSGFFDEKWE